jgi:hypothetical protein
MSCSPGGIVAGLRLAQQRPRLAGDLVGVAGDIAIEFARPVEHAPMSRRHLTHAREFSVGRVPPGVQRRQAFGRLAVGPVTRADDVIDEIAFVVGQDQAVLRAGRRVARHDVVVVKPHHLAGAADLVRRLAIPECQQDVAVRTHEDAGLRILLRARAPWRGHGLECRARDQRQLEDIDRLVAEAQELLARAGGYEVGQVAVPRHRQYDRERDIEFDRDLGDEPVGAFREHRHDRHAAIRVAGAEPLEERADTFPDLRQLAGREVTVPRDRHHQWHGVRKGHALSLASA